MKSRFRIVSPLVQGGFSVVSRAVDETTGGMVALKQARAEVKGSREQLARETETMRRYQRIGAWLGWWLWETIGWLESGLKERRWMRAWGGGH